MDTQVTDRAELDIEEPARSRRQPEHFTHDLVGSLKAAAKPYEKWDDSKLGLLLRVQPTGTKTYYVQLTYNVRVGIGRADQVSLPKAKAAAIRIRGEFIKTGNNPNKQKRQKREEAREGRAAKHRLAVEQKRRQLTVGEFAEANLSVVLGGLKDAERQRQRFLTAFAPLLPKTLASIHSAAISQWAKDRRNLGSAVAKPCAKATLIHDLMYLGSLLEIAMDKGLIASNPTRDKNLRKLFRLKRRENWRMNSWLKPDQERRLFEALDEREREIRATRDAENKKRRSQKLKPLPVIPAGSFVDHVYPLIALAKATALRRGEMFKLRGIR